MSDRTTPIRRQVLNDGDVSVAILSLGCITQDWRVPSQDRMVPVILGYDDPDIYRHNPFFMGAIVGRVANRISGASFELDGWRHRLVANEPPHHLHGGTAGIHTRNWDMEPSGNRAVQLRLQSNDGEQGYPGQVEFFVTITLQGYRVRYEMVATCDRPTPINLAQHNYYNLMGSGTVLNHEMQLAASSFTPTDSELIPTGEIVGVDGLACDFRDWKTLRAADPDRSGQDLNFVLDRGQNAAVLRSPNGLTLTMDTDQPCLQVFTAPGLHSLSKENHTPFGGVCLEPQGYPDSLNRPEFPSIVISPDHPYRQRLDVTIAPADHR